MLIVALILYATAAVALAHAFIAPPEDDDELLNDWRAGRVKVTGCPVCDEKEVT